MMMGNKIIRKANSQPKRKYTTTNRKRIYKLPNKILKLLYLKIINVIYANRFLSISDIIVKYAKTMIYVSNAIKNVSTFMSIIPINSKK